MTTITTYHGVSTQSGMRQASGSAATYAANAAKFAAPDTETAKSAAIITDIVTLSDAAIAAIKAGAVSSQGYGKYMPVRDGFNADALAEAVTNPGAQGSSVGLEFPDVAQDARNRMDAKYDAMAASGRPYEANSFEGRDNASLMGDLDRRSLYAVRSNEGGRFTQPEQVVAASIMSQQQGLAMGLYAGPSRMAGEFNATDGRLLAQDYADMDRSGVEFLDQVSDEEKTSIQWAVDRASAQVSYEWMAARNGGTAEDLSSDQPLAKLVASAMQTMKQGGDRAWSSGRIETADQLKAQSWFKGFESRLDALLQARKA